MIRLDVAECIIFPWRYSYGYSRRRYSRRRYSYRYSHSRHSHRRFPYRLKISFLPSLRFPLFVLQIFCCLPSNILIYPSPINLPVEQEPGRGYYSNLNFTFPLGKGNQNFRKVFVQFQVRTDLPNATIAPIYLHKKSLGRF